MWYNDYWGQMPLTVSMPKRTANKMAELQNHIEFRNYFERYFLLAQNRFKWSGLPDSCDSRFIERMMLLCGKVLIADIGGSLVALGAANSGEINIHGWPIRCYGWGLNGYNHDFRVYVPGADDSLLTATSITGYKAASKPEAVVMYDNPDQYPYVMYILRAAYRMANIMRASDVAVETLKTPYIVTCDEENRKTVEEVMRQRRDNVATIIALKGAFSEENFRVWPTPVAPDTLSNLWSMHCNLDSEILLQLGKNANSQSDKRERLIVPEVNADNGVRRANIEVQLEWRKKGCEWVNKTFGANWSVELNNDGEEEMLYDDPEGMDGSEGDSDPVSGDGDRRGDAE